MKKVLAICLMMVMIMGMTVNVFAAPSGFVSSPSTTPAPKVESFKPADEDCEAQLVITAYSEKGKIPEALEALLEKAKNDVSSVKDLTELNENLAKLVNTKKIDSKNLAVSDLFDIHVNGCEFHEGHVNFDIVLSADALSHFVGLLHMKEGGVWELVEDARVTNNGEHLEFSVDSFSPFAIVVDTTADNVNNPQTGDNSKIYIYVVIMAVCALVLVFLWKKLRKKASN